MQHIKTHFLERLFRRLNAARSPPILSSPFPTPIPYPESPARLLAFSGFHPAVYSCPNEAFQVAKRFWITRAHTMFQLGSAQDWSVNATGMGILSPDLATWPAVTACEMVTEDIFVVTTCSSEALAAAGTSTDDRFQGGSTTAPISQPHSNVQYLVVAATGEVIASSLSAHEVANGQEATRPVIHGCALRADWNAFIQSRQSVPEACDHPPFPKPARPSLISHVKTKDATAFPQGINKAWAGAFDTPQAALAVAARAVLASCALNR